MHQYIELRGKFTDAVIHTKHVEDYAIAQIKQLCDQEAMTGCKVRVMPDVHPGKVGPIGFTCTIGDRVMPAVVGIDIGCGMTMARIKKGKMEFQKLDAVIRDGVPAGFASRKQPHRFAEEFDFSLLRCASHVNEGKAKRSLGTLGGGNHFIELDRNERKDTAIIIHTGSRHLGKEVAEYYLDEGRKALQTRGIDLAYELTYLDGQLKDDYLHDMAVVQSFAEENRRAILDVIAKGMKWKMEDEVSVIHNYIDFSTEVPILRKGAISAKKDETVIIPINMRDGVIIGKGLGNPDWNDSAPHGAGRIMSREQVKNSHTVAEFKKAMKGIYSTSIDKGTLDEAPFAYRGMDDILPYLKETVAVDEIWKPIYNFKAGTE